MKTRFDTGKNRTSMEIMMTPMIDVVFLLLIFFLTTSSFEIIEQLLPGGISDQGFQSGGNAADIAPPESVTDISDCVVRIRANPGDQQNYIYEFNGTVVAGPQAIFQRVQAIIRARADVPIIVDPDDQVSIASAVEVYDQARAAGGLRVYFAAR